jgi:pilus assembly protein CpaE
MAFRRNDPEPRIVRLPPQSGAHIGAQTDAATARDRGAARVDLDRPIDVLALLRSEATKEALINVVTAMQNVGIRAGVGNLKQIDLGSLVNSACDMLLLDVDLGDPAELAILDNLIQAFPSHRPIVVTSANPSMDGMRHLMRVGIADLVPQPIKRSDLIGAFTAAMERRPGGGVPQQAKPGKLICFLNACGGMGATTVAVQSACALAEPKDSAKVVLLDLDVQFGNVAVYLDLASKSSVVDLQAAIGRLDGSMLRGAVARHRCGLDVLAAPQKIPDIDVVTPEGAARLLHIARREYRNVLVDMPHVWNRWTRAVLGAADMIVLVFQASVPSIRQARRQIDFLVEEGLESVPLALVMNRAETGLFHSAQGAVTLKDAAKALGRDIPYAIPNEYKAILEAVNHGLPLAEVKGGKTTARQIAEVMRRILAQVDAAHPQPAANRP